MQPEFSFWYRPNKRASTPQLPSVVRSAEWGWSELLLRPTVGWWPHPCCRREAGRIPVIGRHRPGQCTTTRQYARLVSGWVDAIGLDPKLFGTHSLRRTKATLIYRRNGNVW